MDRHYNIRSAKVTDKENIYTLVRESIAREKQLSNPSLVPSGFLEEFVDKAIHKGNMLVVENSMKELELIGEIHAYNTTDKHDAESSQLKEFAFFSRMDSMAADRETELVSWLFGEIRTRHHDVFRVEITAPVRNFASVDHYKKMGLTVEGNYERRLQNNPGGRFHLLIPLSWNNPSFN